MSELWIVPLAVACFVLIVDMAGTYVRRRLRRSSSLIECFEEENLEGATDEEPASEPQ